MIIVERNDLDISTNDIDIDVDHGNLVTKKATNIGQGNCADVGPFVGAKRNVNLKIFGGSVELKLFFKE